MRWKIKIYRARLGDPPICGAKITTPSHRAAVATHEQSLKKVGSAHTAVANHSLVPYKALPTL